MNKVLILDQQVGPPYQVFPVEPTIAAKMLALYVEEKKKKAEKEDFEPVTIKIDNPDTSDIVVDTSPGGTLIAVARLGTALYITPKESIQVRAALLAAEVFIQNKKAKNGK